jgi:hypothetical protein
LTAATAKAKRHQQSEARERIEKRRGFPRPDRRTQDMKQPRTIACLFAAAIAFSPGAAVPAAAQPSQAAYALYSRLVTTMEKCWFGPNPTDFAQYVYSPEPNAAGGPRILVVPRNAPHELPVLVVEITAPGGKAHLNVYGPLAGTSLSTRIAADLRRWMGGSDSCG